MHNAKNAKKASLINSLSISIVYLLAFRDFDPKIITSLAAGGFVSPYFTWAVFSKITTIKKKNCSIASGIVGGVLSYFVSFFIIYLIAFLENQLNSILFNKQTIVELGCLKLFGMILTLGTFSLFTLGLITVPICAVTFYSLTYKVNLNQK